MRAHLSIASLLCAVAAAQAPAAAATPRGACVLAGGGKLPPVVFARFLELAGGADAHIVLVPTASRSADDDADNEETLQLYRERFAGAEVTLLHTRDRERADDAAFCAPLTTATGVWFGGGDQNRLAEAYLGTRFEREVLAVLARGGAIGGTSAGTAIQSRVMIGGGMHPPEIATGFDCVPGAIVDQHFLKRERLPRLLQALTLHPGLVGIGVDEGTAAIVRGNALDVVGDSKVVLALPDHAGHPAMVAEYAPDASAPLDRWQRVAVERRQWSPASPNVPRVAAGTLLLGHDDGLLARFVALAGGPDAEVVVLALGEPTAAVRDALLAAAPAAIREIGLMGSGSFGGDDLRDAFANATGVWLQEPHPYDSGKLLDRVDANALREQLQQVLARGGVVWGNAALGEVVVTERDHTMADPGYRRGLGLLPGTMLVHRGLAAPGPTGPITDGAPHLWLPRCQAELPRITGIHVEAAALVQGSVLEVLGTARTHLLPPRADANAADTIPLEPGARYDLVTGARR